MISSAFSLRLNFVTHGLYSVNMDHDSIRQRLQQWGEGRYWRVQGQAGAEGEIHHWRQLSEIPKG